MLKQEEISEKEPGPEACLELRLERSDSNLEFELPNPNRDLVMIADAEGFRLRSHYQNRIQKDVLLKYSDIDSVQMRFLMPDSSRISDKYSFSIAGLLLLGFFVFLLNNTIGPWMIFVVLFALVAMGFFRPSYRQVLHVKCMESGNECNYYFSMHKSQKEDCVRYFQKYGGDKFSVA